MEFPRVCYDTFLLVVDDAQIRLSSSLNLLNPMYCVLALKLHKRKCQQKLINNELKWTKSSKSTTSAHHF